MDLVLVGCSATKNPGPSAAADLFAGSGFMKARAYAEASGRRWLILSAKWGVLDPGDVISTYDVYLPDQSPSYRRAWGEWAVAQLRQAYPAGDLSVEVHAGEAYVEPLRRPANGSGIALVEPLAGLRQGERLAWYGRPSTASQTHAAFTRSERPASDPSQTVTGQTDSNELAAYADFLGDPANAQTYDSLLATAGKGLRDAGLYSWWVDAAGAHDLSAGLGMPVQAGLIYLGQAGATRWPSGRGSDNTLWGRLTGMHFGGNRNMSTLRRTLASVLAVTYDTAVSEAELSRWMAAHLRIAPRVFSDRDRLGPFEQRLLGRLDPPLNLQHCPPSPVRTRLSHLRSAAK